jgi:phosphatidylglycerol:prolipoprotein diacylglycerol transferase
LHPILYDFGFYQLPAFGPCVAIGLLCGLLLQRKHAREVGIDPNAIQDFAVWGFVAGFAGSRILYVLLDLDTFRANPAAALGRGGFVWYGGILTATPAAYFLARRKKIPALRALDCLAPGVMLGLAFGRVGCTMAGCDHGREVASGAHWWTLTFTDTRSLVDPRLLGKPLYPTEPLMALKALTVFAILMACRKRLRPWPGALALLMFICYAPLRFAIEYLRGDEIRRYLIPGVLSTSQAISLGVLPIAIFWLVRMVRGPRKPVPAPFAGGAR